MPARDDNEFDARARQAPIPESEKPTLNYNHQLHISKELLRFGKDMLSGTIRTAGDFTRKDYVFFALADKCVDTSEAIRIVCRHRLVDDGFALIRVLVESIINSAFVVISDDRIADDYADFPDFRDWIEFEHMRDVIPEIADSTPPADVQEMRRKYDLVRNRYGVHQNDWSEKNLFKRASTIDASVGNGFHLMRALVNLPWRKACTYVHGTAASIAARVHQQDSGVVIHREFESKEAAGVLFMSNMAMFALLAITDMRLEKRNKKTWRLLYDEWGTEEPARANDS